MDKVVLQQLEPVPVLEEANCATTVVGAVDMALVDVEV